MPGFVRQVHEIRQDIIEQLNSFQDAVLLEIPKDPLLAHYIKPEMPVRIMSEETLDTLSNNTENDRKLLKQYKEDLSCIQYGLESFEPKNPLQTAYKAFFNLLIVAQSDSLTIRLFAYCLDCRPNPDVAMLQFVLFGAGDFAPLFKQYYQNILELRATYPETTNTPFSAYAMIFSSKQSIMQNELEGRLRAEDETFLKEGEIRCPVTRATIDVHQTKLHKEKTQKFMAMAMSLGHYYKVNNDEINQFQQQLTADKLFGQELIEHYLNNPDKYSFSPAELHVLNRMGLKDYVAPSKLLPQLNEQYNFLWDSNKSARDNLLHLLIDYNKEEDAFPSLSLFFTGHWRRHHHSIVSTAIRSLRAGAKPEEVISTLKIESQKNSNYNPSGSLTRRLNYVQLLMLQIEQDTNVKIPKSFHFHGEAARKHAINASNPKGEPPTVYVPSV